MKLTLKHYVSFLLVFFLITACGIINQKNTPNTLEIEFYSKGAGIDFRAKKLMEEFIVNYTESNKVSIPYTTKKYGREGETNFVFDVSNLSKKEAAKFQEAVKEQLKTAINYRLHY
jgi:hypothetical protein